MAERIDLSLDDIIKMNKKNKNTKGSKEAGSKPQQRLQKLGVRSGIIRKGGPKPQVNNRNTNNQQQNSPNKKEPTMLHVSNLHYNVSNDDVRELFSEIGPVKKAVVHYDKSGRSLGTAEVTFLTRDAAFRAMKQYHNVPLDGRPMSITMVPTNNNNNNTTPRVSTKSRIGVKPGSGVYKKPTTTTKSPRGSQQSTKGPRVATKGGKPNTRGNQRQPKKQVTAEDLDADLEAYTAMMVE